MGFLVYFKIFWSSYCIDDSTGNAGPDGPEEDELICPKGLACLSAFLSKGYFPFQPLLKVSMSVRDSLILVLQKAIFSR